MKKLLLLLLFSSAYLLIAQTDPNIKWLHPSPQGNTITWIKMWDDNNWYMGGDEGMFLKTSDAGKSWTSTNMAGWANPSYPGTYANNITYACWFFDKNVGIVGGQGEGIVRTTNAGATWDTIPIIPVPGRIWSFSFVNNNIGYLAGNAPYGVMKTTDGGLTWSATPTPLPASTGYSIYASDANNLIVFGASGAVYISNDAGSNWTTNNIGSTFQITASTFVNANVGYVCTQGGQFSSTTDGGYSWNTSGRLTNYILNGIKAFNNEIYMVGYLDTLFKSTDYGATWTKSCYDVPAQGQIYTGFMMAVDRSPSTLLIAGLHGMMFSSTDDAASWKYLSQYVSFASFVYDIYVENPRGKIIAQGHVNGSPGTVFYSKNGGINWQQSPYNSPVNIQRSQFLDNLTGYFVSPGYYAKTTDGGITLDTTNAYLVNSNALWDLHFNNTQLGWIVGGSIASQYIGKTTDGGTTWKNQTTADAIGISTVDFYDDNLGFGGGVGNYLIKTTDGGSSWTRLYPPIPAGDNINHLKIVDKSTIYVASTYKVFRSDDAGNTWTEILVPFTTSYIFGMNWQGSFGVITGTLGYVVKTTNGGIDWTLLNTGGWTAYGITIVNPDTFYIGGGDGQVFRYAKTSITPVELSSLSCNTNKDNVLINWSTATEKNNYGFNIERSPDMKSWTNLSFIKGAGTSTKKNNYSYYDQNLSPGNYYYRLKQTDFDGSSNYYYASTEIQIGTPRIFELSQNYPNPFNPLTVIKYAIPQDGKVSLKIYDINGKEITALVNSEQKAGNYNVNFDAHYLPSGVYFYKLESGTFSSTKKLILLK